MYLRRIKQTSKWIFIILVCWGLTVGIYLNIINNRYLHYSYYRQREVLWNDRNAVSDFKPEKNRSSTFPLKNILTSGMNGSDVKPDLLSPLHMHINLEAASKVRGRLISAGFSPLENLQIYLHNKGGDKVLFPKRSKHRKRPNGLPWLPEVETCAVLGSGGILKGSKCGAEIDSHDLVLRSNMAPLQDFVEDVGRKTNFTSVNSLRAKKLVLCLKNNKCSKAILLYMNTYLRDAIIWFSKIPVISAFYYKKFVSQVGLQNPDVDFIYAYPNKPIKTGIIKFFDVEVPSSGLYLYSLAGTVCKKVSLYGFYPFNQTESGRTLSFHYYNDNETFQNSHNMPKEYSQLLTLNRTGAVRLVTKECK